MSPATHSAVTILSPRLKSFGGLRRARREALQGQGAWETAEGEEGSSDQVDKVS